MNEWEKKFREEAQWSISPAQDNPADFSGEGLKLQRGIVTKIQLHGRTILIENDDLDGENYVEYSLHGDINGKWMKIHPGERLKTDKDIYLLNRTKARGMELPFTLC